MSRRRQPRGHLGFDAIDEQTAAHGGTGRHRRVQAGHVDHGIAGRRARVEDEIGEVLQFFAVGPFAGAGRGVGLADDGGHAHSLPLELLGHFHRHQIAAAGGDHQRGILRCQREIAQDPFGQAADVFQEHRLPLPIGANDQIVKRNRQLDDGIETGKGAVTGPHLLDHDARVAAAENMHHAPGQDRLREPVRRLADRLVLRGDHVHQRAALGQIIQKWLVHARHHPPSTARTWPVVNFEASLIK